MTSLVLKRRLAGLILVVAVLTGTVASFLGGSVLHIALSFLYIMVTVFALGTPGLITAQVVLGQMLLGSVLLQQGTGLEWALLPVVMSVLLTAELLGVLAHTNTPISGAGLGDGPRRAVLGALLGTAVFSCILVAMSAPGPSGLTAVMVAAAACVGLSLLLVRGVRA